MRARVIWRAMIGTIGLGWLGAASYTALAQTTDGIYADFNTSLGNFTVTLDFTNAPRTAANFIGLATGQRAWMDWNTGQVKTNPFYDGLIFHRVVSNFVIQAGSPNGLGSDGPGYVLLDEISPNLRHSRTGTVAMAKSGSFINGAVLPHTGSSQFYITVATNASTSGLDGNYPVFGQVSSNLAAALAIGRVAIDTNTARPLTNVVINSVSIRRVGAAAQNFNIQAQSLPTIVSVPLRITHTNQQSTLTLSNDFPNAANRLFDSSNLVHWTYSELGVDLAPPLLTNTVQSATNGNGFYTLTRAQYPSSTWAPRLLKNCTLTLMYTYSDTYRETNRISFNNSGAGAYNSVSGGNGDVSFYTWYQDIYRGYIWPIEFSSLYPMGMELNFTNNSGGNVAGTVYLSYPVLPWYGISGTFTLSNSITPEAVTLISPLGTTEANPTLTYTWQADSYATSYELYVATNGTAFTDKWYNLSELASSNVSGNVRLSIQLKGHSSGTNNWYVRGRTSDGMGPWSSEGAFRVALQLPGTVTLTSPAEGATVTNLQSVFTWTAANPAASWYNLLLYRYDTNYLTQWSEVNSCALTNPLPLGNYTWRVRAWNPEGYGAWSSTNHFTVPTRVPAVIQLVSPSGTTTAGAKDYTWVADPCATWYELLVYKNGGPFFDQWYSKDNLTPVNPNRVAAHVAANHGSGNYSWWVRALGPDGTNAWSATMSFTVP